MSSPELPRNPCSSSGSICPSTAASARVLRGASWRNNVADGLLSSYRHLGRPSFRYFNVGFRVVLSGVSSRRRQSRMDWRGGGRETVLPVESQEVA
jgi:hypothetical protein